MNRFREEVFCSLSGSTTFQRWLYDLSIDLYKSLMNHLRASHGCSSNKQKMKEILAKLENIGALDALEGFLLEHYPSAINMDNINTIEVPSDPHNVFGSNYDPTLLTYPMRLILKGGDLSRAIKDVTEQYAYYDVLIVEDMAYIEYLTDQQAHLKDKIPKENWRIAAFRESSVS